jgi:hypothetical protein
MLVELGRSADTTDANNSFTTLPSERDVSAITKRLSLLDHLNVIEELLERDSDGRDERRESTWKEA